MSDNIIQLNEAAIKGELKDLEYTGIIRTLFRYYPDSVLVLSGFDS